jgi:hypothetical protein
MEKGRKGKKVRTRPNVVVDCGLWMWWFVDVVDVLRWWWSVVVVVEVEPGWYNGWCSTGVVCGLGTGCAVPTGWGWGWGWAGFSGTRSGSLVWEARSDDKSIYRDVVTDDEEWGRYEGVRRELKRGRGDKKKHKWEEKWDVET